MTPLPRFASHQTLLIVTPDIVARADYRGVLRPKLHALWSELKNANSADSLSLTESLTQAANLGPKRIGNVSIICSQFWTEIVSLPIDVVAVASSTELNRALVLEAEFESGLSALASRVACVPVEAKSSTASNTRDFLVTQISDSHWSELESAIQTMGGKLQRLAHPAAVQVAQNSSSLTEVYRQQTLWSERGNFSPELLDDLLNAWLTIIASPAESAACCLYSIKQRSVREELTLSCLLAMACCTVCWFWHRHTHESLTQLNSTNERLEQRQQTRDETLVAIQKTQSQLAKLEKDLAEGESGRRNIEKLIHTASTVQGLQNQRWSRLLVSLSINAQDCWLQRIESDAKQTRLHGLATDSSQAHKFAARLETSLSGLGWILQPAATQELPSGICEFTIALQQVHAGGGQLLNPTEIVQLVAPNASVEMLTKNVAEALP
jgi:hypothetical protein